jgi:signal transduction histidine kinase
MNRLWVRLSLVFSSLILLFALLPLAAFTVFVLTHDPPASQTLTTAGAMAGETGTGLASPLAVPEQGATFAVGSPAGTGDQRPPPPFRNPWREIPLDLLRSFVLAGILGIIGGVAASRIVAAPITRLADAVQAVGAGDLSTRVPSLGSSTEIEELTAAFNKMAADLERAAELRTALMADVSHELRTPLTVLEGNLRAALDHVYELDEEQIANLYTQTRHLIRLVNDLRELSLAESAQLPLDLLPLDLAGLVAETAAAFGPLAEEKEVTLATSPALGLPPVLVDRVRLRQVLHNLVGNALRHTPPGGTITMSVGSEESGAALTIADNGEGIDPHAIAHIFDRFYRTDPSRSRETGGSGLGLAIAKALVETQGGSIEASSPGLGHGSVFTLRLPYAQPRAFMAT